jgi:hypothetical protein
LILPFTEDYPYMTYRSLLDLTLGHRIVNLS